MTGLIDPIGMAARRFGSRVALHDDGLDRAFSYRQLDARASALAAHLAGRGVTRGDRVAIIAPNGVAHLDLYFACQKLGAIHAPLSTRLPNAELDVLLDKVDPKQVLVEGARVLDRPTLSIERDLPAIVESGERIEPVSLELEGIACLLFTGGTTGVPKAAMISHRMIAAHALVAFIHELRPDDRTVVHLPLFHAGGLLVYTLPLLASGGFVALTTRWDPARVLALIDRFAATMLLGVPTQYVDLIADPSFPSAHLASLRFVTCGGAPLPPETVRRFRAVHDVPFKQGYGMTEFGPGVFSLDLADADRKLGSIGRPNVQVQTRVELDGELLLRGPGCFSGYYRDEAATRAAIDEQGWLHTGDVVRVDDEGFYSVVDRKKDMFISGGENVFPAEIERVLAEHPSVAECAVIGVADPRWGEVGQAHVVLRARAEVDELRAFLEMRLARFKVPRSFVVRDALPRAASGKLLRRELREVSP